MRNPSILAYRMAATVLHAAYAVLADTPAGGNSTLNLDRGDNAGKRINFAYNAHEQRLLRGLAIGGSTLSIVSAGFMLFWFIRLRQKTFRHQLVMLLILSDFFKALAEFVYPIWAQIHGNTSANALCEVSGYFTAFFIDATDFAVLLIAIHTGLCIFVPGLGRRRGEEGLYRWRHTMYVMWFAYSALLSSLAFLNNDKAYTSSISWCYLPVRPFYWRIALSWAPRYFILTFILVLYISIYVYAKKKFNSFSAIFKAAEPGSESIDLGPQSGDSSPEAYRFGRPRAASGGATKKLDVVSELKTHDLLDDKTTAIVDTKTRQSSGSSATPTTLSSGSISAPQQDEGLVVAPGRKGSVISITLPEESRESRRASVVSLSAYNRLTRPRNLSTCEEDAASLDLESRRESAYSGMDQRSGRLSYTSGVTMETGITSTEVHRRMIVKQLNFVFIYPVVYLAMWAIPFAYHATQYKDANIIQPVVALGALSAFIVPLHGFIDALVYARNEKPWRSLRFKKRKDVESGLGGRSGRGSGASGRGSDASFNSPMKRAMSRGQTAPVSDVERRRAEEVREAQARRAKLSNIDPSLQPAIVSNANALGHSPNTAALAAGEKRDWWAIEEERMQRDLANMDDVSPVTGAHTAAVPRPSAAAASQPSTPAKKKDNKDLSFFDMLDE